MLNVKKISKSHRVGKGYFFALKSASFTLPSSGMVAIYGKSGSGKTTLLNLLSGLDTPSSGRLLFRKKAMFSKEKTNYLRKHVGFVFQHYNLIAGMSVYDNIALATKIGGGKGGKKRISSLLEKVGLKGFRGRNVDTLSGGEKQRVAICRALIKDPDIIFADEPTGALDEKNAVAIMEILKRASKNRLVVFVTHNPEFVTTYGEMKIHIEEGVSKVETPIIPKKTKSHSSSGRRKPWITYFLKRNLSRNKGKNLLCLLSGTIGFTALLLTLGFYQGSEVALEKEGYRILGSQVAYLSEEERVEVPNSPLTLLRQKRPSLVSAVDALEGVQGVTFETDYSAFLPDSLPYSLQSKKQDPVRFFPFYDLSLAEGNRDLLIQGEVGDKRGFSKVLVNEEFAKLYPFSIIGEKITASNEVELRDDAGSEQVVLDFEFTIVGIVKELSFMNEPRVYYSHPGLEDYLSSVEVERFHKGDGQRSSVLDFVHAQNSDSPYLKYRYLLFVHNSNHVKDLYKKKEALEDTNLHIESDAYEVRLAFKTLMEAFASSLLIIVAFSLTGLAAILAMMAFSNFMAKKKEVAQEEEKHPRSLP